MDSYLDALQAMHTLLGALKEQHWRKWIEQDISDWKDRHSVTHHLSAYGGMGSFNDIGFEEVWLGSLFDDLRSACYHFAKCPIGKSNVSKLESSSETLGFNINGWRCLACGYSTVSRRAIDYFVARRAVREAFLQAIETAGLCDLVDNIIKNKPSNNTQSNEIVSNWVGSGGIVVRNSDEWLRPCPACGDNDTAVYRWRFCADDRGKFVPTEDNLPLRIKKYK